MEQCLVEDIAGDTAVEQYLVEGIVGGTAGVQYLAVEGTVAYLVEDTALVVRDKFVGALVDIGLDME